MVMALIYTIVGEYELAIDELEYALSIPAWCSPEYLRGDPLFEPLQKIPRFQQLLDRYQH
ncbi:MAG: hypothetical protein DWP97_05940 [Calditrichaeota bacterium]|nr:MAG: hypothetical protein DWP97_05940 [Calditrichota bacterium]